MRGANDTYIEELRRDFNILKSVGTPTICADCP